jgi:hypothetical protein
MRVTRKKVADDGRDDPPNPVYSWFAYRPLPLLLIGQNHDTSRDDLSPSQQESKSFTE